MATLEIIPPGTPGLQIKLARMRDMAARAKVDPVVRRAAESIVAHVGERNTRGEAEAISAWIRSRVRYTRDPAGVEMFQQPSALVSRALSGGAAGDCDDMAILGSALMGSVGIPTRFAVGGAGAGDQWAHVWLQAWTGDRWTDFDDTNKRRPAGWSPSYLFTRTTTMRPRNLCFGGSAAIHNDAVDLDGFSLRKAVKRVGQTVKKVVKVAAAPVLLPIASSAIMPSRFRAKAMKALPGSARKIAGAMGTVVGTGMRSVGPTVANIVAPGSGAIVQQLLTSGTGQSLMPGGLPGGGPSIYTPPILPTTPTSTAQENQPQSSPFILLAIAGIGIALLLSRRK